MRDEGNKLAGKPLAYSLQNSEPNYLSINHCSKHSVNNRWLLKLSCLLLLVCSAIWAAQKLALPQTYPIKAIQIKGNYAHTDHAQLQQLILPYSARGFLWINPAALQEQLQQLPWIYSANVQRIWPNKLAVKLAEQQPLARLENNSLLNVQGDIFSVPAATIPAGLPLFITPLLGQQKLLLTNFKAFNVALTPLHLQIVALSLDARQSWSLQLDNGVMLILGKIEPLARLQRLVKVYAQIEASSTAVIASIDLRYASGMAVRFKNQTKS